MTYNEIVKEIRKSEHTNTGMLNGGSDPFDGLYRLTPDNITTIIEHLKTCNVEEVKETVKILMVEAHPDDTMGATLSDFLILNHREVNESGSGGILNTNTQRSERIKS